MMKTAQTTMTAGLAKPENASSTVTKPVSTKATSTIMATTSTRSLSLMKSKNRDGENAQHQEVLGGQKPTPPRGMSASPTPRPRSLAD